MWCWFAVLDFCFGALKGGAIHITAESAHESVPAGARTSVPKTGQMWLGFPA